MIIETPHLYARLYSDLKYIASCFVSVSSISLPFQYKRNVSFVLRIYFIIEKDYFIRYWKYNIFISECQEKIILLFLFFHYLKTLFFLPVPDLFCIYYWYILMIVRYHNFLVYRSYILWVKVNINVLFINTRV